MKKNRLLKQGLAVLLSLSMSLGPCAPGNFAAFADTAEVSSEVETGAGEAGADTKEEAGSQEESEVSEEKSEEAAGDSVSEGEEASNDNAGEISDGDASDRGEGVPGAGESDGNVEEAGESGEQDGGNSPEENYAAEYEADSEDGSENEGDPGAVGEETEVSKAEEADTASETAAPETETETAAVTENDETETESAAASEKDEAETEGEVKNSEDRHALRAEIDETVISVIYDEGVFPENVVLEVRKVDEDSAEQEEIREKVEKALKEKEPAETEQEESGVWLSAFEIHVLDENQEEVEPDTEKGEVLVRFEGISFPGGEEEAVFGDDEITVFGLKSAGDDKVKELKQVNEAETELPDDEQFSADGKVFDDVSNIYDSGDISLYSVTVRLDSNQIIAFAGITSAAGIEQEAVKKEAEEKSPAFQAVRVIDGVRVLVTAPEGVFPEGSELSVKKITGTRETEKVEEALQAERDKGSSVALSYLFDIKILCNGEEIEPDTENGNVSVSFTLLGKKAPEKVQADVYHVTETEEKEGGEAVLTAEKLETLNEIPESIKTDTSSKLQTDEASDTVISIETDSFSYYVVEFTYEALQYVLEGDTSVSLSAILWKLGFEGEVSEVSVSDDTLIGVSRNEDGKDWTVTALRAFNTEEWMDVTMDSFVYRITVTDDTASIPLYWGINAEGELKISTKELPSSYTGGTFDGGVRLTMKPWNTRSVKTGIIGGDSDIVQPLDTANWFSECENVESIDMTYLDTSRTIVMDRMFYGCKKLTELDVSHFDTSNVTNMRDMFYGCSQLTTLDVSHFDTSKVTNIYSMFEGCANLTTLDVSHFDTSKVTKINSMFKDCKKLTTLDLSGFDTSNVTDMTGMHSMFAGCTNLTTLDVSGFNTSKVKSMIEMFKGCENLTALDVSGFDTSSVTNMRSMFEGCKNLTALDVSGFNTSNVTTMEAMFKNCENLTTLDLSHFDTSHVVSMSGVFSNCRNLTALDVSHFDTSKVRYMGNMFWGCRNLTTLDLSSFDTGLVEAMYWMFEYCTSLVTIYAGEKWNTDSVSDSWSMFEFDNLLVGGAGTVYNSSHIGKGYARIDGGPERPGYFTGLPSGSGSGTDSGIYNGWRISAEGYSYIKDGEPLKGGPYGLTFLSDGIVFEGNWLFDNNGYALSGLHNGAYYYDQRNGLYPYGMQVPEEDIRQKLKTGRSASATFYSFDHYRTFTDDLNFFQILLLALPSEGLKEIFGRNMNAIGKLAYKLIEKWAGETKSTNWNEVFYKIENSYYWDTSTNKKVLSSLLDEMFNDNSDFNREKKTAQKVAKAVDLSSDVLSKTCEALLSEKQETAGAGNTDLSESGRSVMEKIDNDDTGKAFFNTAKQFASLTKYLYETTDDFRKAFSDYSDRIAYLEELETAILSHDKDKSGALLDAVRELKDNYEKDMTIAMVDAVYTGLNEIDGWYGLFTGKDTESLPDISLSNNINTNIGSISTFLAKKGLNALTGGLLGIGIAGIETIQKLDGRSPALYDYIETLALMEDAQELLKSAEANLKKDECTAYDLAAYFAAFELTRQLYLLQYKAFKAFYQADSDNHGDKELFLEEEINKLIQLTPLNYDAEDLRAGNYNAYWNETEQRYYYRNGEYIKNRWCWLDKKAYYFDAEGHPLTGKQNMTPYTGEVDDDGGPAYYYFSTGTGNAPADQDHYGAMQLGVIVTEDKRYYTEYGKLKRNRRPFAPPYYFTNDDAEILNPDGFADGKNHAVGETPWEYYIRMGASGDTAFNINVVQVLHPSAGAGGLNVIVYNENETQIGAVDGDTITILDEDAVDIRNDSSGSIFIYTLYGNNVRTEIQAEADTMIDYSVVEFSGETMFKRIDYRDIRLGSGGKAVALADYQEDTEYSLMKDQEEQTPDETQTDMVFHAVKVVVTGPNPTEYTRMILKGDTVDLTVEQQGNSAFKGWYSEDGELLSTDLAYCVRVMEDLNLTAVFEEAGVEAFITRLYRICLSREADAGGLEYWKGRINSGSLKGIGLAAEFVFSKEFKSKNYCNEHFVKQIYPALMGREPDAGGLAYWVGQLDSGRMNRESLLNSFTSSAEYKNLCTEAGIELGATMKVPEYGVLPYGPCAVCGDETKVVQFAERMYTVCLDRAAETGGLAYWSKGLYEQTITGKSILENFFLSSEIQGKNLTNREYVRRIYKAMLDRDPDGSGWDYWEGRLNSGASPTAVIAGFIDSNEFTGICNDYGIKRK